MKDFHDLHSLTLNGCLDREITHRALRAVFLHRQTPIETLPLQFDNDSINILQSAWQNYHKKAIFKELNENVPKTINEIIEIINNWLNKHKV